MLFRRDQIDHVRLYRHLVFRLHDLHFRIFSQDIRHQAFIIRGKMLDHHKAQPAVSRHMLKKLLQRLQASCRGADPYDKVGIHFFFFLYFLDCIFIGHKWASFPSFLYLSTLLQISMPAWALRNRTPARTDSRH